MAWDLVIFDCDGVLVDSEPIANRIFTAMVNDVGLPLTYDDAMRDFVGRSMPDVVLLVEARLGRPLPVGFVADYRARTRAAFTRELQPIPGVRDVLDRLRLPVCVASSGAIEKMQTTLGVTGLLARFEGRIFSATEVARSKPAPDLFLHAAARMGASPGRCAVVEDTVLGVEAGIAAGMTVFGFARVFAPDVLAASGARVFHDMRELPALLEPGPDGLTGV